MRGNWVSMLCAALAACGGRAETDSHGTGGTSGGGGSTSTGGTTSSGGTQNFGGGGTGMGGGTCFPGAKVCPDASGQLLCVDTNLPETGCKTPSCSPCAVPHAGAKCDAAGQCVVAVCDAGWADCNGDSLDGCESNLDNDATHCGDCATNCIAQKGPSWSCHAGNCEVTCAGLPGTADCDGNAANGCEVNLMTDQQNCGFCGNVCQFGPCINGACATP